MTIFVFIFAVIGEVFVIWSNISVYKINNKLSKSLFVIAIIQGLNTIWQTIRLVGLLP